VSDFSDIEQFGREHGDCGGITPTAVSQDDGGFVLTLTCACGAFLDRWITAEDANQPLPLPEELIVPAAAPAAPAPAAPPASRAAPRRTVTPSADYDAVLRAAVEAEEAAPPARPAPPPPPAPKRAPSPTAPTPAPSSDLATLVRELRAKPPGSDATRARSGPARLNLDATIDTALSEQDARAKGEVKGRRDYRILWLVLVVLVTVGASTGIYVMTGPDTPPVPPAASVPPPRPPEQQRRAEFDEVMKSLRQLQRVSSLGTDPAVYSSRVIFAKVDVERFMAETPPGPSRSGVREVLDVHVLAAAALKARELRQKDVWEGLGRDTAIDLCPAVRSAVDSAETLANASRAQARGVAVAAAIPLLWECAAEKIAALEAAPGQ